MNNQLPANSEYQSNTNLITEMSLQDYITILRIHLNKIVIIILFGIGYALYYTYTVPPTFHATATVMVREKPGANMIMDFGGNRNIDRMVNEIQLIKSRVLAKEVVKAFWESDRRNRLNIFGTRKYFPKGWRARVLIKELFSLGLYDAGLDKANKYDEPYSDEIGSRFAGKILKGLSVKNNRSTDILEISFNSVYADEARRVADKVAETYVRMDREWGSENAIQSVDFLEKLVLAQEKSLHKAEEEIRDYKSTEKMYDLQGNAGSFSSQLTSVQTEIYNTIAEINIKNEKTEFLKSRLSREEKNLANQLLSNINIQMVSLREEIGLLESQLIQNTVTYGKDHSAVKELVLKIKALKKQLDQKVGTLISKGITVEDPLQARQEIITDLLTLDSEILGLELKKAETEKLKLIYAEKLGGLPQKQLEYARLERNLSVLNQNYSYVRQKLEEAKIQLASQAGKVQILDLARRPGAPSSPDHKRNLLMGIILGLVAGLGLAFLLEFLDNTVKTVDHIEKHQLSVLGIIPSMGEEKIKKKKKLPFPSSKQRSKSSNQGLRRRLITREDPRSPVSEAYRSLRTSMMYTSADKEVKSILISSAGPGEGKTTTVANLAITYANLGKKTLLVDTDLRRPVIHKVLEAKKDPGITNYLSGATDDFNSLIQNTLIDNLSVVTSGIIPPNPSELLGSKRMSDLVAKLESEWDMILFDSPPLVAVTDATMVSKEIDQIIIVVKVGQTDKKAFSHTINSLRNVNAPLGGVILNAVTHKNSYGSYYYYYQYYHYYGSDSDSKIV